MDDADQSNYVNGCALPDYSTKEGSHPLLIKVHPADSTLGCHPAKCSPTIERRGGRRTEHAQLEAGARPGAITLSSSARDQPTSLIESHLNLDRLLVGDDPDGFATSSAGRSMTAFTTGYVGPQRVQDIVIAAEDCFCRECKACCTICGVPFGLHDYPLMCQASV